ncbi:PREDICTED: esterase FE4-like [Nicrophorus vespilloides]|uniref:Carboxylic ester hydrolase n=1 Tax=Nicrophorus vespilloides TaxID=110193 RepID=A0ABM1MQ80_NICVS|nr:PREDICTED: esterase FE4-like [Nicrophorus vespilloides]
MLYFYLLVVLIDLFKCEEHIVEVEGGKLKGMAMKNYHGGYFLAFMSIPYAKPPLGPLRFKALERVSPWDGIRDATKKVPTCLQKPFSEQTGVEDCIYANVYTRDLNPKQLKSVMIYIHEGGFYFGTSSVDVIGPHHLMIEDIVLVTFNYRLGAMGFLNIDGSDIITNNGLKDQVYLLKWVQRNIHKFGGNKDSVTIFGESAGAAAVSLHLLSPMSKGLFHGAISQSGSALSPWIYGTKDTGFKIARELGITTDDPKLVVEELRKVPYKDLFEAQQALDWYVHVETEWNGGIVIERNREDSFITAKALDIFEEGLESQVPYLIGFTDIDGNIMELFVKTSGIHYNFTLQRDIPHLLTKGDSTIVKEVTEDLKNFYFNGKLPADYGYDLMELISDVWFKYPIVQVIRKYGNVQPVYLYEFRADTKLNVYKNFVPDIAKYKGAGHVDDLGYIFKHGLNPEIEKGSAEDKFVEKMVKLWTNFAKHRKPIPNGPSSELDNVEWKAAKPDQMNCLIMDIDGLKDSVLDLKFAHFWDKLYEKYNRKY